MIVNNLDLGEYLGETLREEFSRVVHFILSEAYQGMRINIYKEMGCLLSHGTRMRTPLSSRDTPLMTPNNKIVYNTNTNNKPNVART
jgi:hypothetical protein